MNFIICTKEFSGLGFAMTLQNEGHNVLIGYENDKLSEKSTEEQDAFHTIGKGLIECDEMQNLFKDRAKHRNAYWVFDSNHLWEYADKLRSIGYKVFGASELTSKLEHDREYGFAVAKKAGFNIAETNQFSDVDEAIDYLEQNENKPFVCKVNDAESYLTYVPAEWETPESANRELRSYLESLDSQDFILQEKIKGIEVCVEAFFHNGVPYFALVELECKRKNSGDKGELVGCSQDILFVTELDNGIITNVLAKLFPFHKQNRYTGFGDVNVILADNEVYFIEFCNRFGFNQHVTLFKSLLLTPFADTLVAMIDGKTEKFYDRFRPGFGAGIQMYVDHPVAGFPLYVSKDVASKFYHYESYKNGDESEEDYRLSGFSNEVGVITGYGFTMVDAAKSALDNALKINFPSCSYREDLNETDYPQSPIKRHEALNAMGLIHRHL